MGNIFNEDLRDFLAALHRHKVRYVLVGGNSVILHGYSRTTGDLNIWVEKTATNYSLLCWFRHSGILACLYSTRRQKNF